MATRIIALGQDPSTSMGDVADAVSVDPALVSKILRVTNSPLYAQHRKIENLRQALTLLGLNGTLTLALSFALVSNLRVKGGDKSIDYGLFWRRSLATATCGRSLATNFQLGAKEEFFLASLLQDVGMLALDKAVPELYQGIETHQADHAHVQAIERASLGADHAAVGAWLLQEWNLPRQFVQAVAASHDPALCIETKFQPLARCTAVASTVADIWWREDADKASQAAAECAAKLLGMEREAFASLLEQVASELQQTGALFDVDMGDAGLVDAILEQAKEIVMLRNLQVMQETTVLQKTTASLKARTRELEEASRRDGLTGLYNRAHLDQVLTEEFAQAKRHHWPISIAFVDLDHFKNINDTHGHQAGDEILQAAARLLIANTRDTDINARYGGDEFVVVLPGSGTAELRVTCERLVKAFASTQHELDNGAKLTATVSVGIASHGENEDFETVDDLLQAGDRALYSAKYQGRNRFVMHYAENADNHHAIKETPKTAFLTERLPNSLQFKT